MKTAKICQMVPEPAAGSSQQPAPAMEPRPNRPLRDISSSGLRPDQTRLQGVSGSGWGAGGADAFMPPSLATQRPDGSGFTQHSQQKRAHVLSLGFH